MVRVSRRTVLKGAGIGVGALAVGGGVWKLLADGDLPGFLRQPALVVDRDPIWHLLNRASFGPSPGQMSAVKRMGMTAFLDAQLNPTSIDDSALDHLLTSYQTLKMDIATLGNLNNGDTIASGELDSATVLRAIASQRQLFEVLVLFWSEHFSLWHGKDQLPRLKTIDDREVIRAHALGRFRDLLGASAHSPAMLDYLDNVVSDKDHPNENYARELLELHTLSPGNYTEKDVREFARCLTGWGFVQDGSDPKYGTFFFDPTLHDDGEKTVLGHAISAGGGQQDVETVLDVLARHPATAKFICKKLCRRFISDDPPSSAIDQAAHTFQRTDGDIREVVRTILTSNAFLGAPPKFRRPFEYLVALARSFAMRFPPAQPGLDDFVYQLFVLGHAPFEHFAPDGYKDVGQYWRDDLLARWNAGINLTYGGFTNVTVDLLGTAQHLGASDAPAILDYYARQVIGRALTKAESAALYALASQNGPPDLSTTDGQNQLIDAIALISISPTAHYR